MTATIFDDVAAVGPSSGTASANPSSGMTDDNPSLGTFVSGSMASAGPRLGRCNSCGLMMMSHSDWMPPEPGKGQKPQTATTLGFRVQSTMMRVK